MLCCIFRSKNSTEGETLTGMSIVCDGDDIGRRIVADTMDSRYLTTTDIVYAEYVW